MDGWKSGRFSQTERELSAESTFFVDGYQIPRGEIQLQLQTKRRYLNRAKPLHSIRRLMLTRAGARGGLKTYATTGLWFDAYRYKGFDALYKENARDTHPLKNWRAEVDGDAVVDGVAMLTLGPDERRDVRLTVLVPVGGTTGQSQHINFTAITRDSGQVLGGLTVIANVT